MKQFDLVEIIWDDHCDCGDTHWEPLKDALKRLSKKSLVHTVGYIIKETSDYIAVGNTIQMDEKEKDLGYWMKVLKADIREMKVVKHHEIKKRK